MIPMDESEFLEKVELADAELASDGVPIYARLFRAFHKLAPEYQGDLLGYDVEPEAYPPFVGPNLLKRISEWYEKRYGERFYIPADRGRVPILLRQEVYLLRIPLAYGRPSVSILPLVEGLTEDMVRSLTQSELDEIKRAFESGFALTYEIEDLETSLRPGGSVSLLEPVHNMLRSAIEDRGTSIRCLSGQLDTNGACFHAQQHAEKMLKSYLMARNVCTEVQLSKPPFGHNLANIFSSCAQTSSGFHALTMDIGLLSNVTMDIRYTSPRVEPGVAVETVWAALRVGGLCAGELSGHQRRYRN